ncbi:MAG: LPS export ABC transporter ATP-binding protein, partial [Endomicrobiia bacterium]
MKLKAQNLSKSYTKNKKVVDNVNIELNEGEIVGLLGPNGAGKTTVFKMIVGLLRPDEGNIILGDKDITNIPMFKRAKEGVSYLPQEPSIFRKLTVKENLMAIAEMIEIDQRSRGEKVKKILNEFGLENLQDQKASSLSGGEKRRTEIARAMLLEPYFLLLDEPFVGIDPITVSEIQNMIAKLKRNNIGILITDHNVRETLQIIDRA